MASSSDTGVTGAVTGALLGKCLMLLMLRANSLPRNVRAHTHMHRRARARTPTITRNTRNISNIKDLTRNGDRNNGLFPVTEARHAA